MKKLLTILFAIGLFSCKPVQTENIHKDAFEYIPFEIVNDQLDLSIRETSGLTRDAYTFWTHNDSGNPSEIHQISPDGQLQNKVKLGDYYNKDWEDITNDGVFLYIGDIGNNFGNRKDLRILKVALDSLAAMEATVEDTIYFNFPDQDVFPGDYNHNFDCEALVSYGDSLYIFSKNWQDHTCRMYRLPKETGKYEAELIGRFNTKGIITAAALSEKQDKLVLLGYNFTGVMNPFIWIFEDFEGAKFFEGKATRYNLDMQRQTEAIVFANDSTLLLTAEKGQAPAAALYKILL